MAWYDDPDDDKIDVYNQDGTVFGRIQNDGPHRPNAPKSSIWDDNPNKVTRSIWDPDDEHDIPGDDYDYEPPPEVDTNRPQGFWNSGGNPWWGAPSPGQRWGDDPTGGLDPSSGMPDSKGGYSRTETTWGRQKKLAKQDLKRAGKKLKPPKKSRGWGIF